VRMAVFAIIAALPLVFSVITFVAMRRKHGGLLAPSVLANVVFLPSAYVCYALELFIFGEYSAVWPFEPR